MFPCIPLGQCKRFIDCIGKPCILDRQKIADEKHCQDNQKFVSFFHFHKGFVLSILQYSVSKVFPLKIECYIYQSD